MENWGKREGKNFKMRNEERKQRNQGKYGEEPKKEVEYLEKKTYEGGKNIERMKQKES